MPPRQSDIEINIFSKKRDSIETISRPGLKNELNRLKQKEENASSRVVARDRCSSNSPESFIFKMHHRKKRHVELTPLEPAYDDVTRCVSDKCKKNWNQLN